jgi:hypothetical protein
MRHATYCPRSENFSASSFFLIGHSPFFFLFFFAEGIREKFTEEDIWTREEEVTGEWRRLHNEELYALYSSPNVIRAIKSRRLRWAGYVARIEDRRGASRVLVGRPEGKRHLEDLGVDGNIILKWIFKNWDWAWTGLIWLRIGTGGGRL